MHGSYYGVEPKLLGSLIGGLLFACALWAIVIAEVLLF